jgi:hypothetical protein
MFSKEKRKSETSKGIANNNHTPISSNKRLTSATPPSGIYNLNRSVVALLVGEKKGNLGASSV